MYQLNADTANCRLEVDFINSFMDIDQAELARELRSAALRVKGRGGYFDLLVDFTRAPVMPKDRTPNAREEIEWCVANGLRRSANVVSSTIAKMQLQRLSGNDRFRNFTSRAEAIAWLRSPD